MTPRSPHARHERKVAQHPTWSASMRRAALQSLRESHVTVIQNYLDFALRLRARVGLSLFFGRRRQQQSLTGWRNLRGRQDRRRRQLRDSSEGWHHRFGRNDHRWRSGQQRSTHLRRKLCRSGGLGQQRRQLRHPRRWLQLRRRQLGYLQCRSGAHLDLRSSGWKCWRCRRSRCWRSRRFVINSITLPFWSDSPAIATHRVVAGLSGILWGPLVSS